MHKSLILVMCLKLYKGQQGSQVIHVRLQPYIWFAPLLWYYHWFDFPLLWCPLTSVWAVPDHHAMCSAEKALWCQPLSCKFCEGHQQVLHMAINRVNTSAGNPSTSQVINQSFTVGMSWQSLPKNLHHPRKDTALLCSWKPCMAAGTGAADPFCQPVSCLPECTLGSDTDWNV